MNGATIFHSIDEAAEILTKSKEGRQNIDDGFFIFDIGEVNRRYLTWMKNLPYVKPYYAIKCGPHKPLMKYLADQGAGFDCASMVEVNMALQAGAQPNDIVFSNPMKQISHLIDAGNNGVKLSTFDSEGELRKTKQYHPSSELLIRIWTDQSKHSAKLSARFGVKIEESFRLLRIAKQLDLNVVGVSFHVGSPCREPTDYVAAIRDSKKVFDFARSIGMEFNVLDLGGGFPGVERDYTLEDVATAITDGVETYFPGDELKNIKVIAEPGRYFTATPFSLVTNVIAKKPPREDSNFEVAYAINDGMHGSLTWLNHGFTPKEEMIPSVVGQRGGKKLKSRIYGPTCAVTDTVCEEILLPEMEIGDWIIWKNTGAYTFGHSSGFNGFKIQSFYTVNIKHLQ